MTHLTSDKNNSEISALINTYEKLLKDTNKKTESQELFLKFFPAILNQRINDDINTGDLSQEQVKEILQQVKALTKNFDGETFIQLDNLFKLGDISNSDNNEDEDSSHNYHLSYLTPEEIFKKYIMSYSVEEAMYFFIELCKAHHLSDNETFLAKSLFLFHLRVEKEILEKTPNYVLDWDNFVSTLIFTNSVELFNSLTSDAFNEINIEHTTSLLTEINYLGEKYFYDYLGLDEEDFDETPIDFDEIDNINQIIDKHNNITESILSVFELNDEVRNLILETQKVFNPDSDNAEAYYIIQNAIFNGQIPHDKQKTIEHRFASTKQILSYAIEEQTMFHNIVQGLISKNSEEFFRGTDLYVQSYLETEGISKDIYSLSTNELIPLFFSDYFISIQSPKSNLSSMFIEFLFSNYDEAIFEQFINRYKIPKNVIIRVTNSKTEHEYFLPLIEFALFTNNYAVADSLISLGFKLSDFNAKIIDADKVYHYIYHPFSDLSLFSENDLIYMIEHKLLDANQIVDYQEVTDNKTISVSGNIFFYLAYEQYNDAILRLYDITKQSNIYFNLKTLKNYQQISLLSYYLKYANKSNAYNFDTNVLNIFLSEKYKLDPSNHYDLITVLKDYELESLVDITQYLSEIFPEFYKQKPVVIKQEKHQEASLVTWFDKSKLEQHFKRIEKERDNPNKEYIKYMLSNNHHIKPNLIIEDEHFFNTLQEQFPNFEEVIRFYKSQFRLKKLSGKTRITPVLLLGDPGIGKTYFAKKLAESLNTGYAFLDMASATAPWILTGNNGTWKSAKQGKILETIMNSRTINPIFLMDEIEKARSGEYDPTMSLYQLLEEVNAKSFTDEFVDFSFDASGIIYIACANTLGNLSDPLQTRFKIINVPKPTSEQLDSIIHNIYREATQNAHIFTHSLTNDVVKLLKNDTLRSIKVMIDDAVGAALLEMTMEEMNARSEKDEKIELQIRHFKSPTKKKSMGFSSV